jgi:drug/metabolite transporter (DMT)-like permease
MRKNISQHTGSLCVIISGILFGFLGYFGMNVINQGRFSVFNMLFWRFFLSSVVLSLVIGVSYKGLKPQLKEIIYAFLAGALFYSIASFFYFEASKYIGTGLAISIFFSYPAIVGLLDWYFYDVRVDKRYYVSLLMVFLGIIFIIDKMKIEFDLQGILFSVLSALFYAIYIISRKKKANTIHPFLSSFFVSIGASLTFLVINIIQNTLFIPIPYELWIDILGVSIICTALPILMLLIGLKYITPLKASIISVLEPVFTITVGVLLLGETLYWNQLLGVSIIIIGTLIIHFDKKVIKKS